MPAETRGFNVRALDGTLVKEPGGSGSLWRIHYSVRIPSLVCDHLELTPAKGAGTGEALGRFAANPGSLALGRDRESATRALARYSSAAMAFCMPSDPADS